MFTRHDFAILWKRARPKLRRISPVLVHPATLASAFMVGVLALGALAVLTIRVDEEETLSGSVAEYKPSPVVGGVPCEKQAWPYVDQGCLDAAANRKTRQVRVVSTDHGTLSTITTALPVVEPRPPAPAPQRQAAPQPEPALASGPAVRPEAPNNEPAPQQVKLAPPAVAAEQKPAREVVRSTEQTTPPRWQVTSPAPQTQQAPQPSAEAPKQNAAAPATKQTAATDAMAQAPVSPTETAVKLSKAEKKALKKAERKAKTENRQGVPNEVLEAVEAAVRESAPAERTQRARNRQGVPKEVIEAVEAVAAREPRFSGRRVIISDQGASEVVTVGSTGGSGRRIFIVPRDGGF